MNKLYNVMGLGTFPFASPFGKMDDANSEIILRTFLDECGTYVDVAPTYAFGKVEELCGRVFKQFNREQFCVNTSCGYVRQGDKFVVSGKYDDVIADCDASLTRLGLDYIDMYISHIPDVNTPFSETIAAMKELKKAGKIKHIGVSNVTLEQLKDYNAQGDIEFIQNRFSLLNHSFDNEFQEYLRQNNIGVVAYQVLDRGLLTNKMLSDFVLHEGDLRLKKAEFAPNIVSEISKWVKEMLHPIAQNYGLSIASLAIKWAQKQSFVIMCQCGATSLEQLSDFKNTVMIEVDDDFYRSIEQAYTSFEQYLKNKYNQTIRQFMGLESYNIYSGSASGK